MAVIIAPLHYGMRHALQNEKQGELAAARIPKHMHKGRRDENPSRLRE
jgi:hypothetical protein